MQNAKNFRVMFSFIQNVEFVTLVGAFEVFFLGGGGVPLWGKNQNGG